MEKGEIAEILELDAKDFEHPLLREYRAICVKFGKGNYSDEDLDKMFKDYDIQSIYIYALKTGLEDNFIIRFPITDEKRPGPQYYVGIKIKDCPSYADRNEVDLLVGLEVEPDKKQGYFTVMPFEENESRLMYIQTPLYEIAKTIFRNYLLAMDHKEQWEFNIIRHNFESMSKSFKDETFAYCFEIGLEQESLEQESTGKSIH